VGVINNGACEMVMTRRLRAFMIQEVMRQNNPEMLVVGRPRGAARVRVHWVIWI